MRFAALVALAVIVSTGSSLAAPASYFPRRVTSKRDIVSSDNNTFVDAPAPNDFVHPRIGTVILPGENLSLGSKRDATSDIVQAIEIALQTLLQGNGSVLSHVSTKRKTESTHPVEESSLTVPKIPSTASQWLKDIGNVVSLGVGASSIASAFDGSSNSTRRDLDQALDGINVGGALSGAAPQFEDRSFTLPPSVSSILGKVAGVVSAGGTAATIFSAFDESGNSTKRELGMESGHVHDQRRAISSELESILQQIIASFEGATDASGSTSTSTKRSTSDNDFLGLTNIITPEQLDELS